MILRYGSVINDATTPVKIIRRPTATPAPRIMPQIRCRCGSPRHAIAMTTALSPDSRMLIHMILASSIQNSVWPKSLHPELTIAHQLAGSMSCDIEPTDFPPPNSRVLMLAVYPAFTNRRPGPSDLADVLANDFVLRKELQNFPDRGFRRVRAMHGIFSDRLRVDLPNCSVSGLRRMRCARNLAVARNGVFTLQNLDDHRPRDHEIDQFAKKWPFAVHRVEFLGLLTRNTDAFLGDNA